MSKVYDGIVDDNELINLYLRNKLTSEESIEFEEYVLDKPELLERLELDLVLINNLSDALKKSESISVRDRNFLPMWLGIWNRPLVNSALSFAFGALVIVLVNRYNIDSIPYSGTIDLVEVSPLRSFPSQAKADATYSLSNNADHIMLLLQPSLVEAESALITIIRQSDNTEVFKQNVQLNASGDFLVTLNTRRLESGLYKVSFGSDDANSLTVRLL